ncbi:DUF1850 domain-containing protein [Helicovermis profundi]|uniref:DUF1850 domain-containing protein n=1 Tax=Helicovermis profundi TaxID=3065157 RepID=A0AAU9EEH2_9FIRM|nr:hypothetical protein HLPR_14180 [Clostridia bacterium S502]
MNNRKKIVSSLLIIVFIVIVFLSINIKKTKVVVVEDLDDYMKTEFFLPNNEFSIGYIHSVELTPAEEFLKVNKNNDIVLYKTIYESFGVGLPFSQKENKFDITNGKFILNRNRTMKSIKMRISPIPKHWITVNGTKYQLLDLITKPEDLINIYCKDELAIKIGHKYYKIGI